MNGLGRSLAASSSSTARRCAQRNNQPARLVLVRHAHQRHALPYPIENGLGEFLPPKALQTIAVEWQQGLLDQLNDEVRGTEYESKSVLDTVKLTAPDRSQTLAFNYASLALNNSFFLDNLKPLRDGEIDHERAMDRNMHSQLTFQYGSLAQLKSTVGAMAMGMFSSGWIWFAVDPQGRFAVIPTFGPGTLLVRSRMQATADAYKVVGEEFMAAPERSTSATKPPPPTNSPPPTPGIWNPFTSRQQQNFPASPASGTRPPPQSLHTLTPTRSISDFTPTSIHSPESVEGMYEDQVTSYGNISSSAPEIKAQRAAKWQQLGQNISPLFCVSVHEHAWLSADLGVWGKREYMRRFWTVLDWEKVSKTYLKFCPPVVKEKKASSDVE